MIKTARNAKGVKAASQTMPPRSARSVVTVTHPTNAPNAATQAMMGIIRKSASEVDAGIIREGRR